MVTPRRRLSESRLANLSARAIRDGFDGYQDGFRRLTSEAKRLFEQQDWHRSQECARERLHLYSATVASTVATIRELLAERVEEKLIWTSMKAVYSGLIDERGDRELAETFFNSMSRKVFTTVGVDRRVEFVASDFDAPIPHRGAPIFRTFPARQGMVPMVEAVLDAAGVDAPFADRRGDAERTAVAIEGRLASLSLDLDRAEVLAPVFFRGKAAYLVGRLCPSLGAPVIPLLLALHHEPGGVFVDAVLLDEDEVSVVFSFARSNFLVDSPSPSEIVQFLGTIMPRKRVAELYVSVGCNKHAKTELYRDLLGHLERSADRFEIAPGEAGMVMIVFTLPSFDFVFKVIRDRFPSPKEVTHSQVRRNYRLVFEHDRAGRLVDAQEFEHLEFALDRFEPDVLDELTREAGRQVEVIRDRLVVHHLYVERRVTPLNLYVREASDSLARRAVDDFGHCIRDLASTGIFAGDLLLKNFGVTRHGRVVFYDYDELAPLSECRFRRIPPARHWEDELRAEPWFSVAPGDVFPEEFDRFLDLTGPLLEHFLARHGTLFGAEFWRRTQARLAAGELIYLYPYPEARRLRGAGRRLPA